MNPKPEMPQSFARGASESAHPGLWDGLVFPVSNSDKECSMNPEDMAKHELEQLQVPLTEAEIAELVQATGMLGRRLAYQHDRVKAKAARLRSGIQTLALDASQMLITDGET